MIEQFYNITSNRYLEQFSRPRTITLMVNVVEGRRWLSIIKMDFYIMYSRLLSVTFLALAQNQPHNLLSQLHT